MKKVLFVGFISLVCLTGCTDLQRALRGDEYVDSSLAIKEKKNALQNKKAHFPQLSTRLAKNETEIKMVTSEGDITIKLFPKYAPLAVENFLTHSKAGYYNGLIFHRVINDFIIQSGDPNGDGTGGQSIWNGKDTNIDSGSGFKNEISPYLYNLRGSLAMANSGSSTNTNGSQFFINQNTQDMSGQLPANRYPDKIIEAYQKGGNPSLDGNYTVFGQVTKGMEIVDKIANSDTDESKKPRTDVTIKEIEIIKIGSNENEKQK